MLDLPRYLLGVVEILSLVGFAWLGAVTLRRRLLPDFEGAPAHLATSVLALAILLGAGELLGSFGLFDPVPYILTVSAVGLGLWMSLGGGRGGPSVLLGFSPVEPAADREGGRGEKQDAAAPEEPPRPPYLTAVVALSIAAIAVVKFGLEVKPNLSTGMTGFDSTWYHGPFAAGFFQSGSTWDLHFIAPQFLAWFYPANSEVFHAVGMLAFDRDLLSPLLNLGWFIGCLVACWCIGRPYGVAPWSLALGAIALSVPALTDQAGEARNDIVGIFFLLAAVAIALNARSDSDERTSERVRHLSRLPQQMTNAPVVVGLAAGLAAGTKLNFLLPAAVLVTGLAFVAPAGARWRAFAVGALAALAGGGYWYLRNLVHTGNPLPWIDSVGPISLPAPDQALGGREGHSVLGYLTDGAVWSDWLLPGLHDGLSLVWPLLLAAALAGLLLPLLGQLRSGSSRDPLLLVTALTGLAALLAWLVAPTSASGPEGMPRGFESGLRYLAPALALGLALVPIGLPTRLREAGRGYPPNGRILKAPSQLARRLSGRGVSPARTGLAILVLLVVAIGYPVQRHYLESRYVDPSFTTPGLNAVFAWSRDISGSRIATTSTRQYPLFGTDLSNQVDFIGEERPHGGFVAPNSCPQWRRLLNKGDYDYVITSRDRMEPGKPPYPLTARWTESAEVKVVLRKPPTVVYELRTRLDPSACP
ncbi:MAG TPA: hypothetical protein VNO20_09735 [Solirubrobacterales bacterium]|nr:hypothetical protein [Solirubrobacterales bacterium]